LVVGEFLSSESHIVSQCTGCP